MDRTIAKINLCGSDYMDVLLKDMTIENIPERLGGKFKPYNEPYAFDTSPGGPLYAPQYTPTRRNGGRPPTGRSSLRIDTTASPEPFSPLTVSSGLSPISSVDTPLPVRRRGSLGIATPQSIGTPVRQDRDSPALMEGVASGSTSSSDMSSITASDHRDNSGRIMPIASGAASGQTRTAASMLFPSARRPRLSKERDEISASSISSLDSGETTEPPASTPVPPQSKLSPRPVSQQRPSFPSQLTPTDTKAAVDSVSYRTTTSIDERPSAPTSPKDPVVAPAVAQYMVVVIIQAIWAEFCEFCGSLYEALAQHPLKTIAAVAVFGGFLYLRLEGLLHLMVFPTLLMVAMLRFDLLR